MTINTTASDFRRLVRTVEVSGIILPIVVRFAPKWFVQKARIKHRWTWLVLCRSLISDGVYAGRVQRFATKEEAEDALPPNVPYEVVSGHGCRRFAAAQVSKLKTVPVIHCSEAEIATLSRASTVDTQT